VFRQAFPVKQSVPLLPFQITSKHDLPQKKRPKTDLTIALPTAKKVETG
jgi:hypothetical protein